MTLRYAHVSDRDAEAAAERIGTAIAAELAPTDPVRASGSQGRGRVARNISARGSSQCAGTGAPTLTRDTTDPRLSGVMKAVNARELRQSLGAVLDQLECDGGPVVVCRRRTPTAVLITVKDHRERFVDREANEQRGTAVRRLKELRIKPPATGTTLDLLREQRS